MESTFRPNVDVFTEENRIPGHFKLSFPMRQEEYLIDGKIEIWKGAFQEIYSPVCFTRDGKTEQKLIGYVPRQGIDEAMKALDAAEKAFGHGAGQWPTMRVEQRIKHMEDFTFRMKERKTEIVKLLMWEIGKPFLQAEKEFDRTIEYINDTIDELKNLDRQSSRFEIKDGIIGQIRRAPLGVVLCMGPFNYPLNETFTTLIPALLMGNTVIFKPPKFGVLLHKPLLEVFARSFPAGVVNTVYGDGKEVVGPLMETGRLHVLAFIGTSRVADVLKKQHPKPHRLRSVLGLEAKNAAVVLPDASLELAVSECLSGSLTYNGQRCTALKILFVHKDIVTAFLEKFVQKVSNLKTGLPWDENVDLTPLPEEGKTDYLKTLIADALEKGAKIMNPGGGETNQTFMFPAVLFPVQSDMRIFNEEQFGPVVPVVPYSDMKEVLEYLINSDYGQQVSIFSNNSGQLGSMVDVMINQVCRVNINSQCQRGPDTFPFTGRKDSAEGTLSVSDALRVFSIRSLVAVKSTGSNKEIITNILKEHQSNFLSTDFIF